MPFLSAALPQRHIHRCEFQLHAGVMLVELLIAIVLLAILVAIAIPVSQSVFKSTKAKHISNQLLTALYFTRLASVQHGVVTTLCASDDGLHCTPDWSSGQLAFLDPTQQGRITSNDQILRFFPMTDLETHIAWRGFPNRNYIQFVPAGFTREQNGTFYYCPDQTDLSYAKRIILSKTGRVRITAAALGDC